MLLRLLTIAAVLVAGCAATEGDDRRRDHKATNPSSTSGTAVDQGVQLSGVVTCEDPGLRDAQVFDVTEIGEPWPKTPGYRSLMWDLGEGARGLAVADFTGDGIVDLFVPRHRYNAHVLQGLGDGSFEDVTDAALGAQFVSDVQGVSTADIDGDGDLDLFVYGIERIPGVLLNDGTGHFTLVDHPEWDDDHEYACGGAASFADYDRDGVLDLFYGRLGVMNRGIELFSPCDSMLLRGLGAGAFEDDSAQLPQPVQDIRVLASGWHDFDDNGWPDLYAIADCAPAPQPNQLLWNEGGQFSQRAGDGFDARLAGMGLAVGDLNDDALYDVIVPGTVEYAALYSTDMDVWVDSAVASGLTMNVPIGQEVGWGLELVDLDNDGDLDLPVVFGRDRGTRNVAWDEPDEIYRNLGDGTFEPVGAEWGFDESTVKRGLVTADVNRDGWMDLIKRELGGVVYVHRARCGAASWLEVSLHDEGGNPFAVGARVAVVTAEGTLLRTVTAGSTSYASGGPPMLHFGLAEADVVTQIEVRWPDGEVVIYEGMDVNQHVDITRGPIPAGGW